MEFVHVTKEIFRPNFKPKFVLSQQTAADENMLSNIRRTRSTLILFLDFGAL